MTRPRVLVKGASGFVGRAVLAPLRARGFEVHAATRQALAWPDVVTHAVDLLDPAGPARLVAAVRPSHLLHLAWDVTPGRYWRALENLDWVAASLRLYRAFAVAGGLRMMGTGSCAEYDWTADQGVDGHLDEVTTPLRPATLYGTAKHALHELIRAAAAEDGISLCWGRIFFLYGPHEPLVRLVPSVVVPLLRGEVALVGPGEAVRDFMHVADVGSALACVLDSAQEGPVNIASGVCRPTRDVVMSIADQIGRPDLVRLGARPTPEGEPHRLAATGVSLAGLGFKPRFTLDEGLADTIKWWGSQCRSTSRTLSETV